MKMTDMELGHTIKKEVECCIACLYGTDLSSTVELVSTYQELLGKNVEDGVQPKFCSNCSKFLDDVRNFKITCLNSLTRLFENVITQPLIKFEESIFEDHEVIEENLPQKEIKNELKRVRKVKSTTTTKKRVTVPKKLKRYCNLCQTDVSKFIPHILREHMTVTDNSHYNCTICNKTILNSYARIHFNHHNVRFDEPKACDECGKTFIEVHRFQKHQETHLGFECDYCGKKVNSKARLRDHILTKHMSVKRCYHCMEFFSDVAAYKAHMAWEKETRPSTSQVCDICGFEASSKSALAIHKVRRHSTERVACDKCGKTFKSRLSLQAHHRQHHEELQFACEHCGKKFVAKRPLKLHVESVHERTNYVECDICGKMLLGPTILKRHKNTVHSNVYKFECKLCGRAFKVGALLKKHYYSHQNKRPFNCHLCSTGYYMTDYLKKHYLRVHGIDYTLQEVRNVCRKVILDEAQMEGAEDDGEGHEMPLMNC